MLQKFYNNFAVAMTVQQLNKLNDTQLADIGITRSNIKAHVKQKIFS